MLCIDVNLGSQNVQRLVIKEGEEIQQVVSEFAKTFNITLKKKLKLYQAIEKQFSKQLHCIEEED